MPKIVNIIGQRFGYLTALAKAKKDNFGRWMWRCRCDCGSLSCVSLNNLRSGNTKSCGCLKAQLQSEFGLQPDRPRGSAHYRWAGDRLLISAHRPAAAKKWARRVIDSNPSGCLKCGSKQHLHAHHADAWKEYPERRFDPLNGAPLCNIHHREFHCLHGRDAVTQEQLHEYLGYPSIERDVIDMSITRPVDAKLATIFDLVTNGDLLAALWYLNREIEARERAE